MERKQKERLADAACLLVAVIWGVGFIASQWAIDAGMPAALIMAGRFSIAALAMLVICLPKLRKIRKQDWIKGGIAGVLLFIGFYTQIIGQARTTVSHCAFLTSTNVLMVPFMVWIFTRKKPPVKTFVLAAVTLAGIAILTLGGGAGGGLNWGDALILLCAVAFALHISYLGIAVKDADPMVITFIQMATAAVISMLMLPVTGVGNLAAVQWGKGIGAVVYLGVLSTCVCYMLQTTAQKYTAQGKAAILLSCEGLFGTILSVVLGFEALTPHLIVGGVVIMSSVILLEVKPKDRQLAAQSKANSARTL